MKILRFILISYLIIKISSALLFKLNIGNDNCFYEELFEDSSVILKWKLFTQSRENVTSILSSISIHVNKNDESNQVVYEAQLSSVKNKATFTVKDEGLYRICLRRQKYYGKNNIKEELYANLKINSIFLSEPNLDDAVSMSDVIDMYNKTDYIKDLSSNIISSQNSQMEIETESSLDTIYYTKWYRYIAYTQIFITIIVGLVQLNNLRMFLKSQHVIN